jgi:ABC-type multidrug transport system ATPase subunit
MYIFICLSTSYIYLSLFLYILTGDIQCTSGDIYIYDQSLTSNLSTTMTMIGYCPQVDPLLDLMNAYETLWFFGRIRNIPTEILEIRIQTLIKQVGLKPFAHKVCGSYSGGNKRKLSLAVALIGDPSVLLLDEVIMCDMSMIVM